MVSESIGQTIAAGDHVDLGMKCFTARRADVRVRSQAIAEMTAIKQVGHKVSSRN